MDKFLDRFKPKKAAAPKANNNPFSNFMGNLTGQSGKFQGSGQSLGGKKAGTIIAIDLPMAGPLGIQIEKVRDNGTAIVSMVVAGSQAEQAGLERGDILCFAGTDGQEEIKYAEFLQLAKSSQRPICLEVRRVPQTKRPTGVNSDTSSSADAYARKQAALAAVEAREKANQKWTKPVQRKTATTLAAEQQQQNQIQQNLLHQSEPEYNEPKSEAARAAASEAKRKEAELAAQLGYNPYEANKATAGQARNATVATKHGSVGDSGSSSSSAGAAIPSVAPPRDPTTNEENEITKQSSSPAVSPEFEQAYTTLITTNSNEDAVSSISILQKLLVNATTKGQTPDETAAKFRKVRLANPKISQAIVETEGALDLMMIAGFQLKEEDGESVLLYPADTTGPVWLPTALQMMKKYEQSS